MAYNGLNTMTEKEFNPFSDLFSNSAMCRSVKILTKGYGNKVILLILILNLKWQKCAVGELKPSKCLICVVP